MPFIIAGLGNPEQEYNHTRHNTGRIVLEKIAKNFKFPDFTENSKIKALISESKIGKENVTLVMPNNYMNNSGASIVKFVTSKKPASAKATAGKKAENLIVIYDDLDLPLGKIKISFNKSSGGHRGLESIIKAVKTQEFLRIRVGISPVTPSGKMKKPSGEAAVEKHILTQYKDAELEVVNKLAKPISELIETIITEGREKAISTFVQK